MDKIAIIRVEFHYMPDYVMTVQDYNDFGGWIGLLKDKQFQMKDVKKVHRELINVENFPTEEWGG